MPERTPVSVASRLHASDSSLPFVRLVFGVSRHIPLTYVSRPRVDGRISRALSRDRYVFLRGGSRQGKTSAWRVALENERPLVVPCGASTTRARINAAILRRAGASVTLSDRAAASGERGLVVEVPGASARTSDPAAGLHHLSSTPGDDRRMTSTSSARFEVDPLAPVEIAGILDLLSGPGTRHYVVIEDFHRLPPEVQRDFGVDLKVFHDCSRLLFLVVMIPSGEDDDLHDTLNSELRDRSVTVNVDCWSEEALSTLVERGEQLLNVVFPAPVKTAMLRHSVPHVGRLQEICYALCRRAGVEEPQTTRRTIGTVDEVEEIVFGDLFDIGSLQLPRA